MERSTEIEATPSERSWSSRLRARGLVAAFVAALAAVTLTACPEREGPAEKAGEAVDEGVEDMKDAVTPDGPAEDTGEKLDDATN